MNEHEWQVCCDPELMVRTIATEKYQRELRLFCVACVRRVSYMLPDECQKALVVAEQFALGVATQSELCAAFKVAEPVINAVWSGGRSPDARAYATQAAGDAVAPCPRTLATVLSATDEAASAVGCVVAEMDETNWDAAFDAARKAELAAQAILLRELVPYRGGPPTT